MLAETLRWLCNAIVAFLIFRSITGSYYTKQIVFYLYLSHVLLLSILRFYFLHFKPEDYRGFYWQTEFISVAFGYCVIWGIFQHALAAFPGPLRVARYLVLTVFIMVMAVGLYNSLTGPVWGSFDTTVLELERNLRTIQAFLLATLLLVLSHYMIPIGLNLRGTIFGYGFFIAFGVINDTLRSLRGDGFQAWFRWSQSLAWLTTLLIWSITLWSYHPNPAPVKAEGSKYDLDRDYEQTRLAVARASEYLWRGFRL